MRKKLLVVDGSSVLATAYHAILPRELYTAKTPDEKEKYYEKILHASDGTYTNAITGFTLQMAKLMSGRQKNSDTTCVIYSVSSSFRILNIWIISKRSSNIPMTE